MKINFFKKSGKLGDLIVIIVLFIFCPTKGVKPWQCDICEEAFRGPQTLQKHMAKRHPGTEVKTVLKKKIRWDTLIQSRPEESNSNSSTNFPESSKTRNEEVAEEEEEEEEEDDGSAEDADEESEDEDEEV